MIKEIKQCDIENREHSSPVHTYPNMQVVFVTEQDEGRNTSPYTDTVSIELCEKCRNEILRTRIMPEARGAMGYNKYKL